MHLIGRIASLEGEKEHQQGGRDHRGRGSWSDGHGRPGLAGGLWPRPPGKGF